MIKITEEESINLYNDYGISEWREKCLVLSDAHRELIKDDLTNGIESPLVALSKLPFPHFITTYLKTYNKDAMLLKDPAIGYKLYLLEDTELRYVFEKMKDPGLKQREILEIIGIPKLFSLSSTKIMEILYMNLEDIPKVLSTPKSRVLVNKKFAYICQYIDSIEAERLGLKGIEFKAQNEYVGFDLEEKLNCLNSVGRLLIVKHLGLYGTFPKTRKEISADLHLPDGAIERYIGKIMPYLMHSLVGMKHLLGLEEDTLVSSKTRKYDNKDIRDIDMNVQMTFIQNYILSDEEKLILSSYSNTERKIYIARKYLFSNDREISEYLNIIIPRTDYKQSIQ